MNTPGPWSLWKRPKRSTATFSHWRTTLIENKKKKPVRIPKTSGRLFPVRNVPANPTPMQATMTVIAGALISIRWVILLSPLGTLLIAVFLQSVYQLGKAKTIRACPGDHFGCKLLHLPSAGAAIGRHRLLRDKRSSSLLGFQKTSNLHLAIGTGHGIRVNRQIDRDLANRRQLIAGLETAGRECALHLVNHLPVDRHATMHIELKTERGVCVLYPILHFIC